MKSVFLVRSPLQLMNAVEAKHYFNLRDEDCIMVIMGDRRNKTKIIRLIKTDPQWGKVVVLTDVNLFRKNPFGCHLINQGEEFPDKKSFLRKSIFNANRLNKISRFLGQVEYIFIGFSRDIYMRHFINSTPHKEVFLLDDGNATIEIAKDRKNKLDTTKKIHGTKKIKFYAKKYLLGLKYDEVDSLTFFSAYDVDLSDTDSLVKNDYSYIRKKAEILV